MLHTEGRGLTDNHREDIMKQRATHLCILIISSILISGGCASAPARTSKGYNQLCLSFVGTNIQGVLEVWGYPDRTLKTTEGNSVYVYQKIVDPFGLDKMDYTPLITYPPYIKYPKIIGDVTSGYIKGQNCLTYLEVDALEKIIKVIWKGDCRAEERD